MSTTVVDISYKAEFIPRIQSIRGISLRRKTMNKKFVAVLVILCCLALPATTLAEELKIGYLNMRKVFYEYDKTKAFNETLEREDKKIKKEVEERTEKVRRLRDEMDLLSEKAREKKEPELRKKITELDNFRKDKVNEILRKKEDMFKEIRENIMDVSDKYAKKNGYDVIFDEALFVYSQKKYDITDDIIKRLNK
jgi:outer membrane protein